MALCLHQGFAGPSGCIKLRDHDGPHEYGDISKNLYELEIKELALRLNAVTAERDELVSKHMAVLEIYDQRREQLAGCKKAALLEVVTLLCDMGLSGVCTDVIRRMAEGEKK